MPDKMFLSNLLYALWVWGYYSGVTEAQGQQQTDLIEVSPSSFH